MHLKNVWKYAKSNQGDIFAEHNYIIKWAWVEGYSNHSLWVYVLPLDLEDYKILLSRQAFNGQIGMWKVRITKKSMRRHRQGFIHDFLAEMKICKNISVMPMEHSYFLTIMYMQFESAGLLSIKS